MDHHIHLYVSTLILCYGDANYLCAFYFIAIGRESQEYQICADLEFSRKQSHQSYQMLKELIEFAHRTGNNSKEMAKLISHPPQFIINENDVSFLVQNKETIFNQPMDDDVGNSRCRPKNVRRKEQLVHKTAKEIKSA